MLFVRRGAPAGSYFEDGDRASGVFGVIATGFAVLIGFDVFLAFQSFDTPREAAEDESGIASTRRGGAQFLRPPVRPRLSGELLCYARNVVHEEWPAMEDG